MPPITFPNQRMVRVHREPAKSDFLGIQNENWQAASRDLGAHALLLYLYFASNADGFTLALSPTAIRQSVGMPPQTYRDQFLKLLDKGYLVHLKGNQYAFYETPQKRHEEMATDYGFDYTKEKTPIVFDDTAAIQVKTASRREINNINTINKYRPLEKQVSPTPQFEF